VGFEPTIPTFEGAETVHALDRAAAVIGKETKVIRENLPQCYLSNHRFNVTELESTHSHRDGKSATKCNLRSNRRYKTIKDSDTITDTN
jgi:hypothetical protein